MCRYKSKRYSLRLCDKSIKRPPKANYLHLVGDLTITSLLVSVRRHT